MDSHRPPDNRRIHKQPHRALRPRVRRRALILLLIALVLSLAVIGYLVGYHDGTGQEPSNQECHMRIPTRFIIEEPECANKLIQALGIENVRVVSASERNLSLRREHIPTLNHSRPLP